MLQYVQKRNASSGVSGNISPKVWACSANSSTTNNSIGLCGAGSPLALSRLSLEGFPSHCSGVAIISCPEFFVLHHIPRQRWVEQLPPPFPEQPRPLPAARHQLP